MPTAKQPEDPNGNKKIGIVIGRRYYLLLSMWAKLQGSSAATIASQMLTEALQRQHQEILEEVSRMAESLGLSLDKLREELDEDARNP